MTSRPSTALPHEPLTAREEEVLALLAQGRTNSEIAAALGIRFDTAKNHVHNILAKLNLERRDEAAEWYRHRPAQAAAPARRWPRRFAWASLGHATGLAALAGLGAVAVVVGIAVLVIAIRGDGGTTEADTEPPASEEAAPAVAAPSMTPASDTDALDAGTSVVYWAQLPESMGDDGRSQQALVGVFDAGAGEKVLETALDIDGQLVHTGIVAGRLIVVTPQRVLSVDRDDNSVAIYEVAGGEGIV